MQSLSTVFMDNIIFELRQQEYDAIVLIASEVDENKSKSDINIDNPPLSTASSNNSPPTTSPRTLSRHYSLLVAGAWPCSYTNNEFAITNCSS